ncbi:hypothetical protein D9M71_134390 [compost metagenome]
MRQEGGRAPSFCPKTGTLKQLVTFKLIQRFEHKAAGNHSAATLPGEVIPTRDFSQSGRFQMLALPLMS